MASNPEGGRVKEPSLRKHRLKALVRWLNAHQPSETTVLMLTAILVGLAAGLGAILFRWLITQLRFLSFDKGRDLLGLMGEYYVIVIPAFGGLLVGPLVYRLARETRGHGVPEVMEAVALRGGRIRPLVAVVKAAASSICIGSGGSAGREGPIVQIGSTLDLDRSTQAEGSEELTAGDIATRSVVTANPDEPVWPALRRMSPRDLSMLPVVDNTAPDRLLGVIRRRDIVRAYDMASLSRQRARRQLDQLQDSAEAELIEVRISPDSPVSGVPLAQASLPRQCVIVSVRRGEHVLIPRGDTVLNRGDLVTALVHPGDKEALRALL